jgi:hypothetical protein
MSEDYNQWSTVKPLIGSLVTAMTWMPPDDRDRIAAYIKYDEMYWNDPRQFALRVLEGESPIYIPNARTVVDTTSHYLLKGLQIIVDGIKPEDKTNPTKRALDAFLKRETFYSRFHAAKQTGVARGDFLFHLTANPKKKKGSRISLNAVEPMNVFPIWDDDEPGKLVGCSLATQYTLPIEKDPEQKTRLRRLTYRIEEVNGKKRISRQEAIYELGTNGFGFGEKAKLIQTTIPLGYLHEDITTIPIYWFKNRSWQGEDYGSSELRGIERLIEVVSQAATDVSASLSLEGLGVYATDGGRPVDSEGAETEWEVSPGKVMEVPQGSYFRRVEGVGSITPAVDQIKYLEDKANQAAGLSDVALGKIDAQVAQSGIALAIKFIPTLAKIETRDQAGIDILTQLFFDWKTWHAIFEQEQLEGDIVPVIGDKLPTDRIARVNELNNMLDRKLIPGAYYRSEMEKLGYKFPENIQDQLDEETKKATEAARAAFLATKDSEGGDANGDTLPGSKNGSNNKSRPNESSGTEAINKKRDASK